MKLNRKGYMLVEIVIASVLAISIAFYLLNLTYKFKNTNSDIYQSYFYTKDKILITKNIMSDLENIEITELITGQSTTTETIDLMFLSSEKGPEQRRLFIDKSGGKTTIEYGKFIDEAFDTNHISYYKKELDASLIVKKAEISFETNSLTIKIPIESIYNNNDYSIKLIVDIKGIFPF